ncbi:MAG: SlyX family protein [Methylococcaceae bacterium]|nr:SlyX family protein [Methylococcaceae bacterium]
MNTDRIIEIEIKLAYQEELIQVLNETITEQQLQLRKLEETCRLLNEKLKSLAQNLPDRSSATLNERPPHY